MWKEINVIDELKSSLGLGFRQYGRRRTPFVCEIAMISTVVIIENEGNTDQPVKKLKTKRGLLLTTLSGDAL